MAFIRFLFIHFFHNMNFFYEKSIISLFIQNFKRQIIKYH